MREEATAQERRVASLIVDVTGYAGPLDVLVALARAKHVDLRRVALAEVADQTAAVVRAGPLEAAAEALTLAAELALMKSVLLLPAPPVVEAGKTPRDPAAAFARRLAMREAAERLMDRPRLGREVLARGTLGQEAAMEALRGQARRTPLRQAGRAQVDLLALLRVYGEMRMRRMARDPLALRRVLALSLNQALAALGARVEELEGWRDWSTFIGPLRAAAATRRADPRSAPAAGFAAMLELARRGDLELRQEKTFGPIQVRRTA